MTTQMIIALAITAFMVVLIMMDKLPFGAPPLFYRMRRAARTAACRTRTASRPVARAAKRVFGAKKNAVRALNIFLADKLCALNHLC